MKKTWNRFAALAVGLAFVLVALIPSGVAPIALRSNVLDHNHVPANQAQHAFASAPRNVTNPNFNSPTTTRFTGTVNGWEQTRQDANAVSGVLNIREFNDFRNDERLASLSFMQQAPGARGDDHLLVMGNRQQNTTARTGFRSGDINLYNDGYFLISFEYLAIESENAAYLTAQDPLPNGNYSVSIPVRPVSQQGTDNVILPESLWRTATFFVRTDTRKGITLNLALHLGTSLEASRGVVYYDNVVVQELNRANFETNLSRFSERDPNERYHQFLDLRTTDEFAGPIDGHGRPRLDEEGSLVYDEHLYDIGLDDFIMNPETPNVSGTRMQTGVAHGNVPAMLNFENHEERSLHSFDSTPRRDVMLISAINASASMRLETPITIERHLVYMLSFYSLSQGNANVRVHDPRTLIHPGDLPEHITPFDSGFLSIGTATSEDGGAHARNNWILNTVFITGASLTDNEVYIEFWIGDDETGATGWLLVDELSLTRVSDEYFQQNLGNSNTQHINLSTAQSDGTIQNSSFNIGSVQSAQNPFPLVAEGWEIDADNDANVISGIVNTNIEHWARFAKRQGFQVGDPTGGSNFGDASNPGYIPAHSGQQIPGSQNNNVFMMQNRGPNRQTLTSNEFPLTPGSWTVITFDLSRQVQHSANIFASLNVGREELLRLNLSTDSAIQSRDWRNYSLAIRLSEFMSDDATLVFTIENTSGYAIAFIDNITAEQESVLPSGIDARLDMLNSALVADEFGYSRNFRELEPNGTPTAFAPVRQGLLEVFTAGMQHTAVWNSRGESVGAGHYRMTVTATLMLKEDQGRRFEVIRHPDPNNPGEYLDEPDYVDEDYYGISLRLQDGAETQLNGGFRNIKPEDLSHFPSHHLHGGASWVDFTFYVNLNESADLNLVIEFGNKYRRVWGTMFIREISLERATSGEWDDAVDAVSEAEDAELLTNIALITEEGRPPGVTPPGPDDGPDVGGPRQPLDWYIVPSIIMAAAILLALTMWFIRKIKFNRHIGQKHTSYARDDAGLKGAEDLSSLIAKTQDGKPAPVASDEDL